MSEHCSLPIEKHVPATPSSSPSSDGFCLVLALWGDAYPSTSVNVLVEAARQHSPALNHVILFTDRPRTDIHPSVTQRPFPAFFDRPDFFGHGYRVKIGVFSGRDLPANMPCVYLDLDSMVTGDLGKIAALVRHPNDVFMLSPGNLIGFGVIRRAICRWTQGRHFATGNSSIMAFHSGASPDVAEVFEQCFRRGERGPHMLIDDVFISWAAQPFLRGIPVTLGVSFRREFLARTTFTLWWRGHSPFRQRQRRGIVAITFNGTRYKPDALLALQENERIVDAKGRHGFWSDAYMGPLRKQILAYCQAVVASRSPKT